jgi:hypothetical protein
MPADRKFCPECGALRPDTARFCNSCGHPFGEEAEEGIAGASVARTIEQAGSVVTRVESGVHSAESVVKMAQQAAGLVVTPPADWRVVIGKVPEEIAQQAVGTVISTAERELQERVQKEVIRRVEDTITKQSRETPAPATGAGNDSSLQCPSCGAVQKPSARFCKHCGAGMTPAGPSAGTKSPEMRTCPRCGSRAGRVSKFCGSCGYRFES